MNAELLVVPLIIAVTFFSASIFGFGAGLVAVPLISLLLGVRDAVTLVLIFQLCMGVLAWKSYHHIDWHIARPMTVSTTLGTIVGTMLLSKASVVVLQLFLAAAIILFLVRTLWFSRTRIGKGSLVVAIIGLLGGLFQGLIGTGGPVLTMYLSAAITKKAALRATLLYLFTITSVVRLAISLPHHLFTSHILHIALLSLPLFVIAIFTGQRMHQRVSEHYFRIGINIILAISAIALLCQALL